MTSLSEGQLRALANLGRKSEGREVGWINIGDARALADLGLAKRTPGGWILTAAGAERLAEERARPAAQPQTEIVEFDNDKEASDHGRA